MVKNKIKLRLSNFQWTLMKRLVEQVVELAPIKDYEVESCVISDMYKHKLQQFTFYTGSGNNRDMAMTFTNTEAFAMHTLFGDQSNDFNVFIRIHLEPQLPPCKK